MPPPPRSSTKPAAAHIWRPRWTPDGSLLFTRYEPDSHGLLFGDLFYACREAGLKVGLSEWMTLMEALAAGVDGLIFASFNGAWSVYPFFESGTVILSGIEQGLFVLRPQLETSTPTPTPEPTATAIPPPTMSTPTTPSAIHRPLPPPELAGPAYPPGAAAM